MQAVQAFLASPVFASAATAVVGSVAYFLVGKAGSALEALGARRKILALVVLGKKLEALAYDGPKLNGEQGASEDIAK